MKILKHLFTLAIGSILLFSCGNSTEEVTQADPAFTIEAKIDTLASKTAYLAKYKEGNFLKLDSTTIDSGRFSFSGRVKLPNVQYIMFDERKEKIAVFIENSEISIQGTNLNPENYTILGSGIQTQLSAFKAQVKKYDVKLKAIVDDYYAAKDANDAEDEALLESADMKYNKEDSLKSVFIEEYISANTNSVIAPYLSTRYMMEKDLEGLVVLANSFSDSISTSEYSIALQERVTILQNTAIGQPAPLFAMNDKDSNSIALESGIAPPVINLS